jgi:predicted nucleic acid-binding protein
MGAVGTGSVASTSAPGGLTDTDILIDAARGLNAARTFLARQQTAGIRISVVSAMELVRGCRNAAELAQLQQFLQGTNILPVTSAISQTAYKLMTSFFLSHGLLIPDALIAATALEHGLTLYTKNTRDFQMIPALAVVRPY